MKKGKVAGGDNISSEMLVNGREMLWHNLHALMVTCWEEEFVPEECRGGIIAPLHKEGDECDMGNYRGITFPALSRTCRLLQSTSCGTTEACTCSATADFCALS